MVDSFCDGEEYNTSPLYQIVTEMLYHIIKTEDGEGSSDDEVGEDDIKHFK